MDSPEFASKLAFLDAMRERHADRLRSCGIDRDLRKGPKPSDHAPLLTELA